MRGLNRPGVELGLDDELPTSDRMRIVGDAIDSAVAAGLVQLGIEVYLGEEILDEAFKLLWTVVE